MKRLLTFTMVALFAITTFAQEPKTETSQAPWFDMKNCEICNCMADHEDLMQHIKWETHLIPDGMLTVSVIPEKYKETMSKVKQEMNAAIAKVEAGEKLNCCGFCESMGAILDSGAKMNELSTLAGEITLVTSTDENVIKQIHEHAKRTIAEHKKMMEEMKKRSGLGRPPKKIDTSS